MFTASCPARRVHATAPDEPRPGDTRSRPSGVCERAGYLIATGAADVIALRAADVTAVGAADLIALRAADVTAVGAADLIA
jgi:hypothetical protein